MDGDHVDPLLQISEAINGSLAEARRPDPIAVEVAAIMEQAAQPAPQPEPLAPLAAPTLAFDAGVRLALPADEAAVIDLLMVMAVESPMAPVNLVKVVALVRRILAGGGVILLLEQDGALVGTLGMFFTTWWYTDQYHLEEVWNFVHPVHRRGGDHWSPMVRGAKAVARHMKMKALLGVLSRERAVAKVRLLSRELRVVGGLFLYDPATDKGG